MSRPTWWSDTSALSNIVTTQISLCSYTGGMCHDPHPCALGRRLIRGGRPGRRMGTYARSSLNDHVVNTLFEATPTRNRTRQNLEIGMPEGSAPHGGVIRLPSLMLSRRRCGPTPTLPIRGPVSLSLIGYRILPSVPRDGRTGPLYLGV